MNKSQNWTQKNNYSRKVMRAGFQKNFTHLEKKEYPRRDIGCAFVISKETSMIAKLGLERLETLPIRKSNPAASHH
jgi:hypothetical protein